MTEEGQTEKPAPAAKPIGPTEALELATRAARAKKWEESIAWSLLGTLAMERREGRRRGN